MEGRVYVVGTCDTKGVELKYVKDLLTNAGINAALVDVGTKSDGSLADVGPHEVAGFHPQGPPAVFSHRERGPAVAAMSEAFVRFVESRDDIGAMLGLGGSCGTSLIAPAMQNLPVGVPKLMVSTIASGDVSSFVGMSDMHMVHPVVDIAGSMNAIARQVLGNATHAMIGMCNHVVADDVPPKPGLGITMGGITTPCVKQLLDRLDDGYECFVFHASGKGGPTMERMAEAGRFVGVLDVSTTEISDLLFGGAFGSGADRLDRLARLDVPYVGSCGGLELIKFRAVETVPLHYRHRHLVPANAQVTLMRTTAEENEQIGRWIGAKLNAFRGPVRFLLPEGGLSTYDAPGQVFHDPQADEALFRTLEEDVEQNERRRVIRVPHNLNDPGFADAVVVHFAEITA